MKRTKWFIVGLLVGISLILGAASFADEIKSYIGKQIEGQFPVTVNGDRLNEPGIVVDGKTYLPVRVIGEMMGMEVTFADSEVRLHRMENRAQIPDENLDIPDLEQVQTDPFDGVTDEQILQGIEEDRQMIEKSQQIIESRRKIDPEDWMIEEYEKRIQVLERNIAEKEAELRRRGIEIE